MNWGELKDDINNYCENVFSDAQLAVFAQQAEQRIFNTVQFPSLRRNVTGLATVNNRYLQCPTDFLAPYSMAVIDTDGSYHYLLNKDVNFIRESFPIPTGAGNTGRPYCYALFGPDYSLPKELTFLLGPTPDYAYSIELHYFYYPTSITDGNVDATTTWLSENFDSVLLYGSLVEAYTFLKGEPDMIGQITARYKEALALAKRLGDGMERMDAYRSGQVRDRVV
ncbi:hypothetical protein EB118_22515 [bacterium]|nr:hypothetical protein [bacterium]